MAVVDVLSAVVVLEAMPMASLDPRLSTMISRLLWRRRPALVSAAQMTPLDTMTRSEEMSQRSGSASSALRIGLANASPTMEMLLTLSRWIVSSSSTGSKWRPCMVMTAPASTRFHIALKAPVPCISGAAGRLRGPGLAMRSSNSAQPGTAGSGRFEGASRLPTMSSWRHITPLGMPVVPPV